MFKGSAEWQQIATSTGDLYKWDGASTYIQEPPFFENLSPKPGAIQPIKAARVLAKLGDSVTTDHISPAGNIKKDSPAGKFLLDHGVTAAMFNSYGSRRGNDRVMTRGTFANTRIKNQIAPGTEGGLTTDFTDGQVKPIYDAVPQLQESRHPADRAGRQRLRHGLLARLGRQGHLPPGRQGRHRRVL